MSTQDSPVAPPELTYLGDSVYAEFDGFFVTLTTENGVETTNTIYLEPSVQVKLVEFFERIAEGK